MLQDEKGKGPGEGEGEGGDKPFLRTYKTQEEAEAGFKEKDSKISQQGEKIAALEAQAAEQKGALDLVDRALAEEAEKEGRRQKGGEELTAEKLAELKEEDPGAYADYKIAQAEKQLDEKLKKVDTKTRKLHTSIVMDKHESQIKKEGLGPYVSKLQQQYPMYVGLPDTLPLFVRAARDLKNADDGAKLSLEKEELDKKEKERIEAEKLAAGTGGEKGAGGGEALSEADKKLMEKAKSYPGSRF